MVLRNFLQSVRKIFSKKPFAAGLFIALIIWGGYFLYLWPKMFSHDEEGIKAWGYARWDWTVHFAYAGVFAYQPPGNWFLSHPLFHGTQFSYPFLADALSGVLIRTGTSYLNAFLIPSIIISLALVVLLYLFYFLALKKPWRSLAAVTIFFTSGGVGFYWFFKNWLENGWQSALSAVWHYTQMGDKGIEWLNFFSGELVPQRAFLLGLPTTLFVIIILFKWYKTDFTGVTPGKTIVLGLIASIIMITHVHSFMVLVVVSSIFLIFSKKHWRKWLVFGFAAAVPSMLFYLAFYAGHVYSNQDNQFFLWKPGGFLPQQETFGDWLKFWLLNWGVFFVAAIWALVRKKILLKNPLIFSGIILFIAANLIQFQPNMWDNAKILTWSYLLLTIPVTGLLARLWQKGRVAKIISGLIFLSIILSGALDLYKLALTDPRANGLMVSNEDIKLANTFRTVSEPSDLVLTSGKESHWAALAGGRRLFWGEKQFLWTYGIPINARENEVRQMFSGGDPARELFKKYQIKFVVIGPTERQSYQINQEFFDRNYPLILNMNQNAIYKLNY